MKPRQEICFVQVKLFTETIITMKLGKMIETSCNSRGLSLAELARRSKIPVQTLHGWTTERKSINVDQLKKVATVLEIPFHQLVFGEPDPFETPTREILKEIFTGDIRISIQRIEKIK